jgi:phosphoesterase RecJ-like protein
LKLLGRALTSLRFDKDASIASMVLTKRDFDECGAAPGDSSGFADHGQAIGSVRVVAMLTETEPDAQGRPVTKVSLRSKNTPDSPDVNRVAQGFGGGGHVRAAGARIQAEIGEARRRVIEALSAR